MKKRAYTMTGRAESAARTGERILDAATSRYASEPYDRLRLEDVAADAGVTVQTVIRRFGGKPGLVVAVVRRGLEQIEASRSARAGATVESTLHDLVEHYERFGSVILKVYAEARQVDGLAEVAAQGRHHHVEWCRRTFAPFLRARSAVVTARRLAQIVVICDATTWRILREESALTIAAVELALSEMLTPLLAD